LRGDVGLTLTKRRGDAGMNKKCADVFERVESRFGGDL